MSSWHALCAAGFRLRINTHEEARAIVATARQTSAQRAASQQIARRKAQQRNQVYDGGSAA